MSTSSSSDNVWDFAPPNMPLRVEEWPALERAPEPPKREKRPRSNWKKHRRNRRATDGEEPTLEKKNELDQSLIASPEEQQKIMQLITLFDELDVAAIVSVLRGVEGRMEEAIDQLLVLNDEMEKTEKALKERGQREECDEVSDSTMSKKERMEREISFGDSDLEVSDFEELVEDNEENDQLDSQLDSVCSSVTGMSSVQSSITEKYRILGEDIELPAVPVQDSEVEKWLKEFDTTRVIQRNVSSESFDSLVSSKPLTDSQTTMDSSFPLLGDSSSLNDSVPELMPVNSPAGHLSESLESRFPHFMVANAAPILRSVSEPFKDEEKPYLFALDDRSSVPSRTDLSQKRLDRHANLMLRLKENKLYRQRNKMSRRLSLPKDGTLTISPAVISTGVDPKEQVETVTLEFHQEKMAEMENANNRIDAEKRRAMAWCVEQMMQIKKENEAKEAKIEEQKKELESQKSEIEALNRKLQDMHVQENKLQSLLISSKDMIVEGVQSLQKNFGEVSSDWVVLGKVKELDIVEKMSDFASNLKQELSSAFSSIEAKVQSAVAPAQEELSHDEEKQIWLAEKGSLESYIEELKKKIAELEVKPAVVAVEKETQAQVQTESKESSTASASISQGSQTTANRFENHYSDSYEHFQKQYLQQWESLNRQYSSNK